ncbi:hypothetical protein MN608_06621 [Microdochium nivale]|nr:hypothetical protein MN608_06621 [Microdochium nivale]
MGVPSRRSSTTSAPPVDTCLAALEEQGNIAVGDCSSRLVVTETPAPATFTVVATVTLISSTIDSSFLTEKTTATSLTQISVIIRTDTVTATSISTVVVQSTTTVTSTSTSLRPAVTTTTWNYVPTSVVSRDVEARETFTPYPTTLLRHASPGTTTSPPALSSVSCLPRTPPLLLP